MPSGSMLLPYLFLFVILSGCAANDLVVKRQVETDAKIEFLIQTSKKVEQRQNELAAALQVQDERLQAANNEIKLLKDENSALRDSNKELKTRMVGIVQQSLTPKVEIVNQPTSSKVAGEAGPPEEYLKAFGLYSANNFPAAIETFESFIKNNPKSDFAANALYWIGECYYTIPDFTRAKEYFLKVTESFPKSPKTPDALLKLGYTLSALKENEKAKAVFEKVIAAYPAAPAAVKARERLNAR